MTPELAVVVAGLVAERYTPSPRPPQYQPPSSPNHLDPITDEQATHNRARLLAALDEDNTVIDLRDRQAS